MVNKRMYWLKAITPMHVGAGKGVGFIDMPIMRERVTSWPVVPGSAVKGVLRDHYNQVKEGKIKDSFLAAFGTSQGEQNAGSLVFTDGHIVCFPVRSLYGTFAYVTCPLVLERLRKDLIAAGHGNLPKMTEMKEEGTVFYPKGSKLNQGKLIFFEDLNLEAVPDALADSWAGYLSQILFSDDPAWEKIFKERFAILSNDCFTFLTNTGTEVAARIRIDDNTKIVANGALWYEESLPAEAILAGIVWCDRPFGKTSLTSEGMIDCFCRRPLSLQIGGKATVGKGMARCTFSPGAHHAR